MTRLHRLTSAKNVPLPELNFCVFISIVSFGFIGFYCVGRMGFETSYAEIRNIIGINFFLILFPFIFQLIGNINKAEEQVKVNTIGLSGVLTLCALVFLIVVSLVISYIGYWILPILVWAGYFFWVVALLLFLKSQSWYVSVATLILSSLFVLWLFGRVYSSILNPLAFENLALGISILDTFYHSSIMEMIKTFGIPSTGLNGTPYLPYHWGSHWILARFATLLNASSTTIYHLVYPSLFICLFLKSTVNFAYDLFRLFTKDLMAHLRPGVTFWVVFIVIFVGFLPTPFLRQWAVFESWIESESYTIALFYFFTIGSLSLFVYKRNIDKRPSKFGLYFLPIAILLPLLGLIKISVLLIAIAIVGYLFLKIQLFRNWINILFICMMLLFSYYILGITASNYSNIQANSNFQLLHFVKTYALTDWKGFFYYIHFFYTFLYLFLRLRDLKITAANFKTYFFTNALLDVEIVVIVSILGLIPASLFNIDGGSAYYFTDIQTRVSAAFLLAYVLENQLSEKGFFTFIRSIGLVVPAILLMTISIIFYRFETAVNMNLETRITLAQSYGGGDNYVKTASANILYYLSGRPTDVLPKLRQLRDIPPKGLESNAKYQFIKKLAALDKLPQDVKKKTRIYVARSNEWFWKGIMRDPATIPFTIPALTGMSSISGLPDSVDYYLFMNYGYHTYRNELPNYTHAQLGQDSLCNSPLEPKSILVMNSMVQFDTLGCK